ncbi:hypothetical protein Z043-108001 [Arapaima gigas]
MLEPNRFIFTADWFVPMFWKEESVATFKGNEFFCYDLSLTPIQSSTDEITLSFRTLQRNGLMLHTGKSADYVNLSLKSGAVWLVINLGSGAFEALVEPVNGKFNDNAWHDVRVTRNLRQVLLFPPDPVRGISSPFAPPPLPPTRSALLDLGSHRFPEAGGKAGLVMCRQLGRGEGEGREERPARICGAPPPPNKTDPTDERGTGNNGCPFGTRLCDLLTRGDDLLRTIPIWPGPRSPANPARAGRRIGCQQAAQKTEDHLPREAERADARLHGALPAGPLQPAPQV